MKLTEIKQPTEDTAEFLTDPLKIEHWIEFNSQGAVSVTYGDEAVDIHGLFLLRHPGSLASIPFQIGTAWGEFHLARTQLRSLRGCPKKVTEVFNINNIRNLRTLDYLPEMILGPFWCRDLSLDSLVGIEKKIKRLDYTMDLRGTTVQEGGIGLLLIPGLRKILHDNIGGYEIDPALQIIQKYAGMPERIYECQAELIDNGLERNAIL